MNCKAFEEFDNYNINSIGGDSYEESYQCAQVIANKMLQEMVNNAKIKLDKMEMFSQMMSDSILLESFRNLEREESSPYNIPSEKYNRNKNEKK